MAALLMALCPFLRVRATRSPATPSSSAFTRVDTSLCPCSSSNKRYFMLNYNPRVQTAQRPERLHVQSESQSVSRQSVRGVELYLPPGGCSQEALGGSHLLLPVRF